MKLSKLAKKVLLESNSDLISLELYSVSFQSDSHSEVIYYGADEKEALKQFNDFDDVPDKLLSSNYLKVDLSKATYSYRYIGDEEEREYFPIEEYFDDESLYELVDEGDFDVIKDRKIAARYPNKESNELLDKVNSYFFDKYGKLKYNIIPINNKDGCIQLRIADHTENLANITRYTEDRCDYFISVVISDSDATEYKFKDINTTLKTTKDIQLKYTSDDTLNFIVNDIEKLIKKLTNNLSEMKLKHIFESIKLNENQIERIRNIGIKINNKIKGGFLNKKQAEELQKEIESNYNNTAKFGQDNNDIRTFLYNYDNPFAEKDINGINLRIIQGLIEDEPHSGNRKKTWLLYADKNIIGKFYKLDDIEKVIKYIEENLKQ